MSGAGRAGGAAGAAGAGGADGAGGAAGDGGPAGVVRLVDRVAQALSNLPSLDDAAVQAGRDQLAATIQRIVADQSTPVEAKLARLLDGLATGADLESALSTDLRSTLADLVADAGRQADNPSLPAAARGALQSVRERAETLLGKLDLQQLTSAAHAARPGESYVVLQLPMPGRDGPETVEIRVRQDGQRAKIDPNDAHVVFQFQLQGLQTVRISLRVLQRHLSCQVGSSDPAATELLRQHAPELKAGLGGLGYLVDDVHCAQLTAADLAPPAASAGANAPPPRVLRLDARA